MRKTEVRSREKEKKATRAVIIAGNREGYGSFESQRENHPSHTENRPRKCSSAVNFAIYMLYHEANWSPKRNTCQMSEGNKHRASVDPRVTAPWVGDSVGLTDHRRSIGKRRRNIEAHVHRQNVSLSCRGAITQIDDVACVTCSRFSHGTVSSLLRTILEDGSSIVRTSFLNVGHIESGVWLVPNWSTRGSTSHRLDDTNGGSTRLVSLVCWIDRCPCCHFFSFLPSTMKFSVSRVTVPWLYV